MLLQKLQCFFKVQFSINLEKSVDKPSLNFEKIKKFSVCENRFKKALSNRQTEVIHESGGISPLSWLITAKSHNQIGSKPRLFGSKPRLLGSKPRLLGSKPRLFGSKPRLLGSKPRLLGSKPRLFGSKPRLLGSKPRLFGSKPRLFGSKPRLF